MTSRSIGATPVAMSAPPARPCIVIAPVKDEIFIAVPDGTRTVMSTWSRARDQVDITVRVPSGTAMKISSFTGAITMHGRAGGADIATGVAPIDLDVIDGDLRLRYGGANA